MPHGNNHQVFVPCGIIDLLAGMLLVTLEDLEQHHCVLGLMQWCEDRGET